MSAGISKPFGTSWINLLIHSLLSLGAVFMVFPFVWMIATSFKSEDEILKTGKSIVVLPDAVRPSFLNNASDAQRISDHDRQLAEWNAAIEKKEVQSENSDSKKKKFKPFEFLDNYRYVRDNQSFYRYFLNTLFIAITITVSSLFFASLSAYAFAFFKFPFKDGIFVLMLGTMMIPQQALLIPDYIVLAKIGMINTYSALIVPWVASVYSVFFL
ncbi:carbohydrate ABC transporter permease, partial [bacterium]|nr:carbohydrate ABC transporter permease [bacterium]